MDTFQHPGIRAAIECFGSQKKLAKALPRWSQQTISRVLNSKNPIHAELAIDIEKATKGRVPRWTLRPDLFSPSPVPSQIDMVPHASAA